MSAAPLRDDPLPPFRRAADIRRSATVALRPPQRMTVSQAAERYRRLNNPGAYVGPWRNAEAPYLREPMDRCRSRAVEEVYIVAPSQTGKSEIMNNVIVHAIKIAPADILVIQPTKDSALDYAERRVENQLLKHSPEVRNELRRDKVLSKTFRNGSMITLGWAVKGQLASRPVPIVIFDERDRMPDDIGGEGDPATLGRQRKKQFGRNGKLIMVSSPSRDMQSGIVGHFYEGDQNIPFWPCPHCKAYFSPGFDADRHPTMAHLHIPPGRDPEDLRKHGASLVCPHCRALIAEIDKAWMLERLEYIPRGMSIGADGVITGDRPPQTISSFWWNGFVGRGVSWGNLAALYVTAQRHFERTGDEAKLQAFWNTELGFPYRPVNDNAQPLEIRVLEGRRERDWAYRTVPAWVRFLVAAVDSQKHHFAVQVVGFDEHGASGLIDRYDLSQAADGAQIDPANVGAHWDLLYPLVMRSSYPLAADPDMVMPIACTVFDTGGAAGQEDSGVHIQARNFARRLIHGPERLEPWRIMLVKGAAQRSWSMLPATPKQETDDDGRRRPDGVAVYTIGQHLLKNLIDNRLRLDPDAPSEQPRPLMRFPATVPDGFFAELTAERKDKGAWVKTGPNESWDLWVYAEAARQRLRTDRVSDWSKPPFWATARRRAAAAPTILPGAAVSSLSSARRPGGRRMLHQGIRI
ncbi:terminase large subunit [Paramagnetospirillum caucaseum]|uniref:Terminase large subunit n=1 Tax=Paramagnetospirillum caucaseum TaxID=1244869 RepID=M3AEW4_9PROT|nr:terminase gpA endonuclease subunit [Paramagnetospirillum caucaseum]EME71398.1 terminase large subunit [Paramagnetospirillum caucaseum]